MAKTKLISKSPTAVKKSKQLKNTAAVPKVSLKDPAYTASNKLQEANLGDNAAPERLIDASRKSELIGIVFIVIAVLLALSVFMPAPGLLEAVNIGIFNLLGTGAIILPFAIILWALGWFFPLQDLQRGRLAIGLGIIFIAAIALLALATPNIVYASGTINANYIFAHNNPSLHGGYVGGGLAWATLSALGLVGSYIVFIALIIAGLIVCGFSFAKLFSFANNLWKRRKDGFVPTGRSEQAAEQPDFTSPYNLSNSDPANQTENDTGVDSNLNSNARIIESSRPTVLLNPNVNEISGDSDLAELGQLVDTDTQPTTNTTLEPTNNSCDTIAIKQIPPSENEDVDTTTTTPAISNSKSPIGKVNSTTATNWNIPQLNLLKSLEVAKTKTQPTGLSKTAQALQYALDEFAVEGKVDSWISGPTVTLFRISLASGVRLSRITGLSDDFALALSAQSVRIVAPIPGTSFVGIEIPNSNRTPVLLADVLKHAPKGKLELAIGQDVEGNYICADLSLMPHLLIGGSTGAGKSVAINAMIVSLLMQHSPVDVKFILVDPKRVELSLYNGIPHLMTPVVTDPKAAARALNWAVIEMERRLKLMEQAGVKNLAQYNDKIAQLDKADPNRDTTNISIPDAMDIDVHLPQIVVVIDELADLMMVAGKDVETSISRLSQLARAAGIHLIIATQRPSTNVITGLIKANIVNRIAFKVGSDIDSRVILDVGGAKQLVGAGDLLFSRTEYAKPLRVQGCYVSEAEIASIVANWTAQGNPEFNEEILLTEISAGAQSGHGLGDQRDLPESDDPLLWEAAEIVVSTHLGSTSTLQRRLKVGFARAGRIMDMLEAQGIVGAPNGSKPRDVLLDELADLELLRNARLSTDDEMEN